MHPSGPIGGTLIIDDDVGLLNSWTRLANSRGLQVSTASSWDEGLALFHVLSPDLVIADYNLPGSKHGLRLLAMIRRLRPSVRLLLISGAVEPSTLAQVEPSDVVDRVLSKGETAEATEVVMKEIRDASDRSGDRTDWRAFATAFLRAEGMATGDLDEIDSQLKNSIDSQ